jgi:hypothetical protein
MNNVQTANLEPQQSLDLDDAADAILDRWSDGETLSDEEDQEATPETVEETEDDTGDYDEDAETEDDEDTDADPDDDDDTEEKDEDEEADEDAPGITDDTLIEILIDGEAKQASVKDLKRLYGQEASLTRKSQEVATKRKEADEAIVKADASYQRLLQNAESRYKPYEDVDMLLASRNLSAEDFTQLRQDAKAAHQDLSFLRQEANTFYQSQQEATQQQLQVSAKECSRILEAEVEGWGNEMYNNIRSYAVKQGLPQEAVDKYVDPQVIKILNKARLYDEMKSTADTKKSKATVVVSKNKKVLRSKKAPVGPEATNRARIQKSQSKLMSNSSRSGDLDDITDALLARWEQ